MTGSEKLRALEEQVETLTKEVEASKGLKTQLDEAQTALKSEQEAHETTKKAKAEVEGQLETEKKAKTELTEKVTKLEGEAKTADLRAREIGASFGATTPGNKPADSAAADAAATSAGGSDILAQFNAIKDPVKRRAFYQENKKALLEAESAAKRSRK